MKLHIVAVYTSSIMLFSFGYMTLSCLLEDLGFSEVYLDSENFVFLALKKHSGLDCSMFLILMVVLSINEGLLDSREIEAQKSLSL